MKKYFIYNNSQQQGPYDIDEIKNLKISKDTPIWFEGINDWTNAEKIDELKSVFASIPPPFIKPTPPPIQKQTVTHNTTQNIPKDKKRSIGKYIILTTIAIVLAGAGIYAYNIYNSGSSSGGFYESITNTYQERVMSVEEIERASPTNFLTADGTYRENFWGNKIKVKCTITNSATVVTYKDVVVRIAYYSKTGTEITNASYTIYETFSPNSSKTIEIKIDNYKNVSSIGWDVIDASNY